MARKLLAAVLSGRLSTVRKARDELRTAIEGKRAAEAELQSKTQAVQHLRAVVQAADAAEWVAGQAQAASTAGATAWAHAGANDADTDHQSLIEQAATLRRQGEIARIRAKGAQQALPTAEEAEERAQRGCGEAAAGIRAAVGAVLVALVEPEAAKARKARQQYLESFNKIRGAFEAEDPAGWGEAFRRNLASGLSPLRDLLNELAVPSYAARGHHTDAPDFDPDQWAALAKRLATDPDAIAADVDEG